MFNRIFPRQFDNAYRGHWLGLWLFVLVALAKLAMGANSIINTRFVATSADGIPLDSYTAGGAQTAVALFALLGLFNLLLGIQSVVVAIRYRAMIPFMYLLYLILFVGSRALALVHPIDRSGATTFGSSGISIGPAFILAIAAVTLLGFVLSLQNKEGAR